MGQSRIYYIDTRKVFVQAAVAVIIILTGIWYWKWTEVTAAEFISPELKSSWHIGNKEMVSRLKKGIHGPKIIDPAGPAPGNSRFILKLYSAKETVIFRFGEDKVLYNTKSGLTVNPSGEMRALLEKAVRELRLRSPYGEIVLWEEVSPLFPCGTRARITDLESGRTFMAERAGGYSHADVMVPREEDAEVVRELFGGDWSWKRRAVVLRVAGRKIAASMTGMPQVQYREGRCFDLRFPLSGNAGRQDDMSYRIMYCKAAGMLRNMLQEAGPGETVLLLFTAIDQRDWETMKMLLSSTQGLEQKKLDKIIGVSVKSIRETKALCYLLQVSVSFRTGPYNHSRELMLNLFRDPQKGYYLVRSEFMRGLLDI